MYERFNKYWILKRGSSLITDYKLCMIVSEVSAEKALFQTTKEVKDLTLEELKAECTAYRRMYTWLPAELQYLLGQIGKRCYIATRLGTKTMGTYYGFDIEIKYQKIYGKDVIFDHIRKKSFVTTGENIVPNSTIAQWIWIDDEVEQEQYTYEPVKEETNEV